MTSMKDNPPVAEGKASTEASNSSMVEYFSLNRTKILDVFENTMKLYLKLPVPYLSATVFSVSFMSLKIFSLDNPVALRAKAISTGGNLP